MEKSKDAPELVELFRRYEKMVDGNSGIKAELRRIAEPQELLDKPSFYRLMLGKSGDKGWHSWLRVVFFFPYVKHKAGADPLGRQLAKANINPMRLFQVLRSNSPNDLIQLRRLVQQVNLEPSLDWQAFGETLFYWNKSNKQQIMQDYFLTATPEEKSKLQGSPQ